MIIPHEVLETYSIRVIITRTQKEVSDYTRLFVLENFILSYYSWFYKL